MHPPLRVSILPGAKVVAGRGKRNGTDEEEQRAEREKERERKGERMERKLKAGAVGI